MKVVYITSSSKDNDSFVIKKASGDNFEKICTDNHISYVDIIRIEK